MVTEGGARSTAGCMLGNGEGSVNEGISLELVFWTGTGLGKENSKDLGDREMDAFADGVSLGIVG